MIILKVPENHKDANKIEDRLKSLSLAYKRVTEKKISDIQLADGATEIEGFKAIEGYLDQLQGELNQWYYCAC